MPSVESEDILASYAAEATGAVDVSGVTIKDIAVIGAVVLAAVLGFHLRFKIISLFERIRNSRSHRTYVALNEHFQNDIESGLSSETFNVRTHNAGDSRRGLAAEDKQSIQQLMADRNLTFDQARLQYVKDKFGSNNVGPDGMPLDPKTVTF